MNMCQPVTSNLYRCRLHSGVHGGLIVSPMKTVCYGPCSFAVAGPSTWNALPAPLRNDKLSGVSFHRQLNTELYMSILFTLAPWLARKYQWYISMIYIMILSWYFQAITCISYFRYFWYFQNINLYYYYLLTFLIHAYLTQTAQVPKLLDVGKILPKILTLWVGRNNATDDRRRRTAHAIGRT